MSEDTFANVSTQPEALSDVPLIVLFEPPGPPFDPLSCPPFMPPPGAPPPEGPLNCPHDSADDSLHSNNSIKIAGGTFNVESGDDGVHADNTLNITGGNINVN